MELTRDTRFLTLLSAKYPSVLSVRAEMIRLRAILNLPKGTEHFMSDIHGEHEAFLHILNNGSGAVYVKIDETFGDALTLRERRSLASLIYYPEEKLFEARERENDIADWYRVTLHRMIRVAVNVASKYSQSYINGVLPSASAYIMEELLSTEGVREKEGYFENIIAAIVETDSAESIITDFAEFIKCTVVDRLHIVGDIFDRGPHADVIIDHLITYHNADIEWGNHDVLWLGAAAGNPACVAAAVKNCVQYDNLDMVENAYGINFLPLALFASENYDEAPVFEPRKLPEERYRPRDMHLYARMHKAISVILFKLEGQLIQRRKEYHMQDRDMLSRVNWDTYTIEIDSVPYQLRDKDFPTVDKENPNALTKEEKALMDQLTASFMRSEKLQSHAHFLYDNGSIYRRSNGNLLYHGCIPTEKDGSFMKFDMGGRTMSGRVFLNYADRMARQGFFSKVGSEERSEGGDFLWFLWCGRNSPIFGRREIKTFERALLLEEETWKEPKNAYYDHYNDEDYCRKILEEFGLDKPWSRIINGHIPVKAKDGEDPRKANGRLVVIDGGFCRAYQKTTGIAGYTMFFGSHDIHIAAHEPFTTREHVIREEEDITSHSFIVEKMERRLLVSDTDKGDEIRGSLKDLEDLLTAYERGTIKTQP